jgi:hypothetical protein
VVTQSLEFDTERLAFRAWQDKQRSPFAAMNSDAEVVRYFPALLTSEQTSAGIDIWRQQFTQKGWSNGAVELLDTGQFMLHRTVDGEQLPLGIQVVHDGDAMLATAQAGLVDAHDLLALEAIQGTRLVNAEFEASPPLLGRQSRCAAAWRTGSFQHTARAKASNAAAKPDPGRAHGTLRWVVLPQRQQATR